MPAGDHDPQPLLVAPPIVVRGRVEPGDQRGRTLGVPTANVVLDDDRVVPDGVYAATYTRPDGRRWPAAVSVGRRPTFYGERGVRLLEAHLVGFTGPLYGENAEVVLWWYLRRQRPFASPQELAGQLHRDIEAVGALIGDAQVVRPP